MDKMEVVLFVASEWKGTKDVVRCGGQQQYIMLSSGGGNSNLMPMFFISVEFLVSCVGLNK